MVDNNDSHDDPHAYWRLWCDQWRDALAAGQGACAGSPWPVLTEAIWATLQDSAGEDPEALARRLREGVRQWRHALSESLPSRHWLMNTLLMLTQMPAPHAPASGVSGGIFADFASMPRLGPLQHQQARLEALSKALEAYHEALSAYLDQLAGMAETAVDALEQAVAEDATVDRSDARAVFDLWCQLAESEYERQIADDDYAEALGALTNRWSELQLALQPLLDDWLETVGMPSRRTVDDTQAALDRLRRQHKAETRALRERLAALESRLEPSDDPSGSATES